MSRSRILSILSIPALLAGCGPPPASAQSVSPNIYEVAPEQQRQEAPEAGFIEVSGQGSVAVAPDQALVSFAVETREDEAGAASTANAELMEAVMAALRGGDLPGLEIGTFGYTLRPEYTIRNETGERHRVIDGYTALNNIRVTVTDVDAAGRVIDLAIGAGANRVAGLSFATSDTEAAQHEALSLAVGNARAQAATMAAALGHELGAALEVRGGSFQPRPREDYARVLAEAASPATPVEAATQTVTASVTIKFALGPRRGGR